MKNYADIANFLIELYLSRGAEDELVIDLYQMAEAGEDYETLIWYKDMYLKAENLDAIFTELNMI